MPVYLTVELMVFLRNVSAGDINIMCASKDVLTVVIFGNDS